MLTRAPGKQGLALANASLKRQSSRFVRRGGRPGSMKTRHSLVPVCIDSLFAVAANSATVPLFPSQFHPSGQGFVRVINHSDRSGQVSVWATDDFGMSFGPVTLSIGANKTAHFNSKDLEVGNTSKGLSNGIGSGQGDWWLEISSSLNIEAIAYMRTTDGFFYVDVRVRAGNRQPVSSPRVQSGKQPGSGQPTPPGQSRGRVRDSPCRRR